MSYYNIPLTKLIPLSVEFYKSPYNNIRRSKLILFNLCLSTYESYLNLKYNEKIKIIKAIEKSCYNYSIDKAYEENIISSWNIELFCDLYHSICYKISSNLENDGMVNNPNLTKAILSENIDINKIPKLSSQELFPQKYVNIFERVEASKTVIQNFKTSEMYKCFKCHAKKCTIENRYNRSLDEGVNLTITCMNCNHSWNG